MSRKPVSSGGSSLARPAPVNGASGGASSMALPTDICPVCKRVRYLNNDMEFRINPECYHAMCSNCVNDIFKSGPAQCPYPSCVKTLRQRGFRAPFFADLRVEREVDIRRRVQAVFNMTEDDFVSLRDYNNYLQEVEDLTFDLIYGAEPERAKAEARLHDYEAQHKAEIERNRRRGREAESARKKREGQEREAAAQRRVEEEREEERARAEEAKVGDEVMEALARGERGSAAEIQERILAQKRAKVASMAGSLQQASDPLSIRGLRDRRREQEEDEEDAARPYDPFGGLDLTPTRYGDRAAPAHHDERARANPWLADARSRDDHRVPGYDVTEYAARALFEAFAGLGIDIAEDKAENPRAVGTSSAQAAAAGGSSKMDIDE